MLKRQNTPFSVALTLQITTNDFDDHSVVHSVMPLSHKLPFLIWLRANGLYQPLLPEKGKVHDNLAYLHGAWEANERLEDDQKKDRWTYRCCSDVSADNGTLQTCPTHIRPPCK